jgi:ribose/xylose/arabinose/galactoside ABC-type transport system permease subunit
MMYVLYGLTSEFQKSIENVVFDKFNYLAYGRIFSIPVPLILFLFVLVVAW